MIKKILTTNHTNQTNKRKKDFRLRVRIVRDVRGLFILLYIFTAVSVYTQTGVSLETEIQNIERSIARQGIPAQERHAGLVRLATLRQLSGDIEGAARAWLEAARAIPNRIDDDALLNCAYCLAAMGEWERSKTAIEPLLAKLPRARFLNASIDAVTTKNTATLASIADNPEYASMKSEIYFLLWRLTEGRAKDTWRQRLVREFPQSPETRLAQGNLDASQTVALRQSPFWLFIGGLDSLPLITGNREQVTGNREPAPPPTTTPAPVSNERFQTGIYSQESNAQAQAQRLRQAGFTPTIEERLIGENKMWAVTVQEGTLEALRSAGFEAFQLR